MKRNRRLRPPTRLAETFLIPRLAALQQQHPLLDLEINADRRALSLRRYQSDIALRFNRPDRGEVIARRVADLAYRFYGTPAWRGRIAKGATPRFIGFDAAGADFPEASWLSQQFEAATFALRCNNQTGQIAAARAGFGIALLPHFLAAGDPALVEVQLSKVPPTRQLWLLTRRDVHTNERIRVVTDFLLDLIQRERSLFEGRTG